jgi:hypothetical protein
MAHSLISVRSPDSATRSFSLDVLHSGLNLMRSKASIETPTFGDDL